MTRFKFLFGHKTAAWKTPPKPELTAWRNPDARPDACAHGTETLIGDFDEGNDDVNAIQSSLGLADFKRPASE